MPIGLAVVAIGLRALPSSDRAARAFDWLSTLLNAVLFAGISMAAADLVAGRIGVMTVVFGVAAIISGVALLKIARGQADPMVPIDLLRTPRLRASYVASISAFAGQTTGLVASPFYLQPRFGHVAVGLLITAFPIGMALGAPLSGRLSDRLSPGPLGLIGLSGFAIGYGLLALAGSGSVAGVVAYLALAGFGMGLFQSPNNRMMMGEAPRHRSGAAAGMIAVCRLIGQTLGALAAALTFRLVGTASWAHSWSRPPSRSSAGSRAPSAGGS